MDGGVFRIRVLSRPKDVEIAQRDRLQAIHARKDLAIVFAGQFRRRIGRDGLRRYGFMLAFARRVAISGGGCAVNQASRARVARLQQDVERAGYQLLVCARGVAQAADDAGEGGQVKDQLSAAENIAQNGAIGDGALVKIQRSGNAVEVFAVAGGEVIQHAHAIALGQQTLDQVRADEARAASDDSGSRHNPGCHQPPSS